MVHGRYNYSIHGGISWFINQLVTGGGRPVYIAIINHY